LINHAQKNSVVIILLPFQEENYYTIPCFVSSFFRSQFHKTSRMEEPFPETLEGFGYRFNSCGQLRKIDPATGKLSDTPFEFKVMPNNHHFNQRHYEALGEVITDHVYGLLETQGKLKKHYLKCKDEEDHSNRLESFVFMSDDIMTNSEKVLILIHGSGVVRAGQWARRLIINENLDTGTQLPFIERARKEGYAVVVTNTNDNYRIINNKKKFIQGSENPVNHLLTVWDQIIEKSPAKHVAIVAHSYGGVCTLELANQVEMQKFTSRVFGIAMTDSVHSMVHHSIPHSLQKFLCKISRNWVSSGQPLDAEIQCSADDIERVSAGHPVHEMTTYCSTASIFRFLDDKLKAATS